MPKMRNADTVVGQLVQWMGRKCRNHHPLEELLVTAGRRRKLDDRYQRSRAARVYTIEGREDLLVYVEAEQCFLIKTEQISLESMGELDLVEVGF